MIEIKTLTTFEELQVGRPCRRVLPGGLPMRQTEAALRAAGLMKGEER